MLPNGVDTDTRVRIPIDIDDNGNADLISYHSVTLDFCCQYNNSNMPDAFSLLLYGTK